MTPRHRRRPAGNGKTSAFQYDKVAAQRFAEFCLRFLVHSKGQFQGQPFELLPWQFDKICKPLFGVRRRSDGTRRYRRAYISVAKKNGKSTLASAIALYGLLADDEPGAEIYSVAADRDQASIIFRECAAMVEASAVLSLRLDVVASRKRIVHKASNSFYQALSADVPTKEGLNAHYILFDELHAQRSRAMYDTLRYAGSARRQPMFIMLTTAGFDRNSICYEQYQKAQRVADGTADDDAFFSYIAEAPADADWTKPAAWKAANPSLGVTLRLDDLAADAKEAADSVIKENAFRRYRLNQWTQQDVRWLTMDRWDACCGEHDWKHLRESMRGRRCFGGLDLAVTQDLTALVLLFPEQDGCTLLPWFFCPETKVRDRETRDRVPYLAWHHAGMLDATPGEVTDYAYVRKKIRELSITYPLRELAVDRAFQGAQLCTELMQDGHKVIAFGQGMLSMTAPTEEFERRVIGAKLVHGGHPILRWMAGNCAVITDAAGNIKPAKDKSTDKIDGIVAAIMALGRAMQAGPDGSIYDRCAPLVVG